MTPTWLLTGAYWFHMVATVLWIGGLFFQALFLQTIAEKLAPRDQANILEMLRKRFNPIAWLCLAVLVITGLTQMAANENYAGFLAFTNSWAKSILIKHLLVIGMILLAAIQTWWLGPRISALSLRLATGQADSSEVIDRQRLLVRINLLLSLLVIAFTAMARTA